MKECITCTYILDKFLSFSLLLSNKIIWFWISSSLKNVSLESFKKLKFLDSVPNYGRLGLFKDLSKLQILIASSLFSIGFSNKIFSSKDETSKN